jgi:hypothetical protein
MLETPILFIIFNRPDTSEQVFEEIRNARPRFLFIAADGPRWDRPDDIAKCAATRKVILDKIDWDCEVKTLFRDENLGCGRGPAEAITWFFNHVEQGIILEDDCLPSPFFFEYCSRLLDVYRTDERIMLISGQNPLSPYSGSQSILFSKYSFIWGWASWRRSWEKYDYKMSSWQAPKNLKKIRTRCSSKKEFGYWKHAFGIFSKESNISVWDYQFQYALFVNNGISIVPKKSLIKNIGIGHPDATHTVNSDDRQDELTIDSFSLENITTLTNADVDFDQRIFSKVFSRWAPKFNLKVFLYDNLVSHMPKSVVKVYRLLKPS